MIASAILVSMSQEMFNDAKLHLEQAEEAYRIDNTFKQWSEVRTTTIFAISSLESFIKQIAYEYVKQNKELDHYIKDYLEEKRRFYKEGALIVETRYIGLKEKIGHWTTIITGNDFDKSDRIWQDFCEVLDFRHDIIHYKSDTQPSIYNIGTIDMARKAINSIKAILERFYDCWGKPIPDWINQSSRFY